ncbi:MAG: oligopeptidase B, partial [Jiangellaceae bacterium]
MSASALPAAQPPVAKRVPATRSVHSDDVADDYAWLRNRDDPDTIGYLEAENAYTTAATAHTKALQDEIFDEVKGRTLETDRSVPSLRDGWFYYTRTVEGQQYPIHCRARTEPALPDDPAQPIDPPADEHVLLDQNELAGESPYFALGAFDVSPDGRLLAFSTDFDGGEKYTLRFKNLDRDEMLPDHVPGTYYTTAWSADCSTLFYTTVDEAMRPYRVWRHTLGADAATDVIVHEEPDERFFVSVGLTRSREYIMIELGSQITSEARVLSAHDPTGDFAIVEPRRQGIEYSLDHSGGHFFVVHNDGAENFELAMAPVTDPGRDHWRAVIPHREDTRVTGVEAFADHLVVSLRRDGSTGLHIVPLVDGDPVVGHDIAFPEEVRTVGAAGNPEFATGTFRLSYTSLGTPSSVYDYHLASGELQLRKQQPVLGRFDPAHYVSAREWATASDGTLVPISVVR